MLPRLLCCGLVVILVLAGCSSPQAMRADPVISRRAQDPFSGFSVSAEGLDPFGSKWEVQREMDEAWKRSLKIPDHTNYSDAFARYSGFVQDESTSFIILPSERWLIDDPPSVEQSSVVTMPHCLHLPDFYDSYPFGEHDTSERFGVQEVVKTVIRPDRDRSEDVVDFGLLPNPRGYIFRGPSVWDARIQYVPQDTLFPIVLDDQCIVMLRVSGIGDVRFDRGEITTVLHRADGSLEMSYRVTLSRMLWGSANVMGGWPDDAVRPAPKRDVVRTLSDDAIEPGPGREAVLAVYDDAGNLLRHYEMAGVRFVSLWVNDQTLWGDSIEEIVLRADAISRGR